MYRIEYLDSIKEDLAGISKSSKDQIRKAIEKKLTANPIEFGKPLQYSLKGLRRLRVGDYRVIFKIEEKDKTVLIVKIADRSEGVASIRHIRDNGNVRCCEQDDSDEPVEQAAKSLWRRVCRNTRLVRRPLPSRHRNFA